MFFGVCLYISNYTSACCNYLLLKCGLLSAEICICSMARVSIRYGMLSLWALLELVFGLFYFAYGGDLLKWVIFSTNFELFYVELITIYSCIA